MDQGEAVKPKVEAWMQKLANKIGHGRWNDDAEEIARHHAAGCDDHRLLCRMNEEWVRAERRASEAEKALREQSEQLARLRGELLGRVAILTAHRARFNEEHDPLHGKMAGYCVVCGLPWPCEYAGHPPAKESR